MQKPDYRPLYGDMGLLMQYTAAKLSNDHFAELPGIQNNEQAKVKADGRMAEQAWQKSTVQKQGENIFILPPDIPLAFFPSAS